MVVGGLSAVGQSDIKRLMAYSSISQMGYIFLGLGIATPLSIFAAFFHLFNHSVFKSLLFLNAGAVEYATGTRDMNKLGGLMQKMPVTGSTNFIGILSISGIPPFSGFWSKLLIILAAVAAGHRVLNKTWRAPVIPVVVGIVGGWRPRRPVTCISGTRGPFGRPRNARCGRGEHCCCGTRTSTAPGANRGM